MAISEMEINRLVEQAKQRKDQDYYIKSRGEEAVDKLIYNFDTELRRIAAPFFINGSDKEDVLQECRLGFVNSIDDYNPKGGMGFRNFSLTICIKRHLITSLAAANRNKFKIHNNAVSLDTPIITGDDYTEQTLADLISETGPNLLESIVIHEEYELMFQELYRRCTPLERRVLLAYSPDESYKEMAETTHSKAKTIDNALMRIRKKAEEIKKEFESQHKIEELKLQHIKQSKEPTINSLDLLPPAKPLEPEDEVKIVLFNSVMKFESLKEKHYGLTDSELIKYLPQTCTAIEEAVFLSYYSGDELPAITSLYQEILQQNCIQNVQNAR